MVRRLWGSSCALLGVRWHEFRSADRLLPEPGLERSKLTILKYQTQRLLYGPNKLYPVPVAVDEGQKLACTVQYLADDVHVAIFIRVNFQPFDRDFGYFFPILQQFTAVHSTGRSTADSGRFVVEVHANVLLCQLAVFGLDS